jgi:Mg-chelatase subunit ChlD/anti-sigma factor RsiW
MNPELPPNPRAELEAKITAWLLGELSAEEAAGVRELIAKDAELRQLQERLSQTLNLLRETVATPIGETPAQPAPLKLSPARREKLLAHFKTIAPKEFAPKPRRKISWLIPLAAAASIALLVLLRSETAGTHGTWGMHGGSPMAALKEPVTTPVETLSLPPISAKTPVAMTATPPPSQIVLPQSGEQQKQLAGANSYINNGSIQLGADSFAFQSAQDENKKLAETPTAGPADVAGHPSETSKFFDREDSSRAVANADAVAQTEVEAIRREQPVTVGGNFVAASGFGGGGANAYVPGNGPVPWTPQNVTNSLLAWGPDSSTDTVNGWADKDKLAKEKPQEQTANRRAPEVADSPAPAPEGAFPSAAPSAPVATTAPTHAAERMLRTQGEGSAAHRKPSAITPIPDIAQLSADTPATTPPSTGANFAFKSGKQAEINFDSLKIAPAASAAPATNVYSISAVGNIDGSKLPTNANLAYADQQPIRQELEKARTLSLDDKKVEVVGDVPLPHSALPVPMPQAEVLTRNNAFTTFSLNISDVAFKLAQASLENGVMPDAASMRSEEFINAFDYRDPEPAPGAPIGFAWERAGDPFAHNRDLLRFSIKTAALGRQTGRPLNLVLLLDKSGSMERADRVEIIANALRVLASQLQPNDTLSVVVFARTARLFVDGVPGSEAGNVAKKLRDLTPEGGTNLEEAMRLAYETALRHYLPNGENRVVLLTDGAANLGNVEPQALKQKVESNRKQGIALDCFGVGWDGYNDDLLETLSRAGNGRYGFINTPEEAATEFAGKLAGALRVAAADVKVQVEFNTNRVTSYRQIGYAKDQLKKEDFRDNSVKAAQIGAAESGNALYTVEINPAGEGPVATVHVRFRVPGTGDYQEHEWTVPYTGSAVPLDQASPAMRLTVTAAEFSEWLAGSPYAGDVTPDRLLGYLRGVPQVYGADARPKKLEWMIRQAKSISGK